MSRELDRAMRALRNVGLPWFAACVTACGASDAAPAGPGRGADAGGAEVTEPPSDDAGTAPSAQGDEAAVVDEASAPPSIPEGTPVYEVPVPAALAPYARYPVPEVVWTVKNGERRLEYGLPADLVGAPQQVELVGPDASATWTLAGETFGTATCTRTGARVVCMEKLAGVPIDMAALEQRAAAGQLSAQQLEVARTFQSDPIGILHFDAQ